MDEQALIRTYGNSDLPEGTANRPLVTFALFAYNQEKYIREAVEGAFSQTYSPLEIILSDDCSDDRTFEIMQAMAAAYNGPHEVRVARTDQNLGVTAHVLLRGGQAKGEVIVVAAGDDISKPSRCAAHLPFYTDTSVMAVSGRYDLIDEHSEIRKSNVAEPVVRDALEQQQKLFKYTKFPYCVIQGSTASYRKSIFALPLPQRHEIKFSEDNLFSFLIYAHGHRVTFMSDSLVKYRIHEKALSNRPQVKQSTYDSEIIKWKAATRDNQKYEFFRWIGEDAGGASVLNIEHIDILVRQSAAIKSWPYIGFLQRAKSLASSVILFELDMAKWKIARIFGSLPKYQPKQLSVKLRGR